MTHPVPSKDVDFLKYKASLIAFMKSYPQFTDYDFEGSNLNVLIDLLTYNTYNMVHYDSMVGNEAWTDTAQLRQSMVSHATDLNYLPRSRISSQCTITVEVYPNDSPPSIILPKNYRFRSVDQNNNTIYFLTTQDYITNRSADGRYVFSNITVYQGELREEFYAVDNVITENGITTYADPPFVISSASVDINSLEVYVYAGENAPSGQLYTFAPRLSDTTEISFTYFLRGIYDDQYAVEFGDGTFGAPLTNGNMVKLVYRATLGPVIQGNYVLAKTTDISGYTDIVITTTSRVQGGFNNETVEELRTNAPRYFQTQDRAVTSTDYEVIIKKAFPQIQQVSAFGGEQVQQYGKVMIVLKPFGTTGIIPNYIKTQIVDLLKSKNIVPEPILLDPVYFYVGITGNFYYNGQLTSLNNSQLTTNVVKEIVKLNDTPDRDHPNYIGDFGVKLYQSTINDTIKLGDSSITGSDINMSLIKRWVPSRNINETLTFTSNNPFKISADGRYQNANDFTITSSPFLIWYNNAQTEVIIQDDGLGNLYYYGVSSGVKIQIGTQIGTVDYENGAITLNANILDYSTNYIAIHCTLRNKTIQILRDSYMIIDGPDINLQAEINK